MDTLPKLSPAQHLLLRTAARRADLPSMNWPNYPCDPYWDEADWLPPWYILERWWC